MIITESLVTICHHTKMLHNHWLYSPCCAFHTCDSFILQLEVCKFSFSLTYFFLSFVPLPSGNHLFVLCIYDCFCFVMFVHLFCFFDSTYKWDPHISEIWLISLTIILSRSIWVVPNDKIAFIFEWLSNIQLCTYMPCILCPFIYWRTLRLLLNLGYSN